MSSDSTPEDAAAVPEEKRAPLVLVVDDDEAIREWVVEGLAMSGFRVAESHDGADALAKAVDLGPDVVLTDLQLPVLDGWELITRLKHHPRTSHTRFIAMTGFSLDGAARHRARECGCDAFLAKPCLPETIALEVRLVMQSELPPIDESSETGTEGA
ncbi:MAG TPA: response regulator [Vicinamibacterales bacterium]|nr:response regulator [Vicinamibacterales bacterium]